MRRLAEAIARHWQLLALTALTFALWDTVLIFPLRMLVVFVHELSHAVATWATGGRVEAMSLSLHEGGETLARGGSPFLIASAGYLGSLLFGIALFLAALRTRADRAVLAVFGAVLIAITLIYFRTAFAVTFGVAAGVAMLAAARYLRHEVSDLLLRTIALTSLLYVPYDIFTDVIARPGAPSDARTLAETYGGPVMLWGAVWLVASLLAVGLCLRHGLTGSSNIRFARSPIR